jgi:hypothetical protein
MKLNHEEGNIMTINTQNQVTQNTANTQQTQRRTRSEAAEKAAESSASQRTGNDYLQDLKNRYPNANISAQDFGGSASAVQRYAMGKEGEFNDVAIHPAALEKYANNPEAAALFEENLKIFIGKEQQDKQRVAAYGAEITGRGMVVDKDGKISLWTTVETAKGSDSVKSGSELRAEARKDAEEKAKKKADEKKAEEKRAEERKEAQELTERLAKRRMFITARNADELSQNLSVAMTEERFIDIKA